MSGQTVSNLQMFANAASLTIHEMLLLLFAMSPQLVCEIQTLI